MTWPREFSRIMNGRTYYEEVTLKMGPRERRVVPGSYLLITPDMEEHIVSSLSMRNINCSPEHIKEDVDYAHGKSFARVENTILERVVFGEGVRACPPF